MYIQEDPNEFVDTLYAQVNSMQPAEAQSRADHNTLQSHLKSLGGNFSSNPPARQQVSAGAFYTPVPNATQAF